MITLQFQTTSHIFGHFEVESLGMLVVLLDGPLRSLIRGFEQSIAGDGEILRNVHLSNMDLLIKLICEKENLLGLMPSRSQSAQPPHGGRRQLQMPH